VPAKWVPRRMEHSSVEPVRSTDAMAKNERVSTLEA
jgi:hypothetical protein